MKRKWLLFYLANWYAFAVSGALMALQHPSGTWLADLPWAFWGTEIAQALAGGEAVSGGALWILLGASLAALGVVASLVISLSWMADQDQARKPQALSQAPDPQAATSEAPLTPRAQEAVDLVEDPRLRSLIQQLNTRLG
jgi:hypothetical protein